MTTHTLPVPEEPSTAVTGTRTAPVADPASMPIVTGRPGKTCWSVGTGQRTWTLVPSWGAGVASVVEAVRGLVPMVRF